MRAKWLIANRANGINAPFRICCEAFCKLTGFRKWRRFRRRCQSDLCVSLTFDLASSHAVRANWFKIRWIIKITFKNIIRNRVLWIALILLELRVLAIFFFWSFVVLSARSRRLLLRSMPIHELHISIIQSGECKYANSLLNWIKTMLSEQSKWLSGCGYIKEPHDLVIASQLWRNIGAVKIEENKKKTKSQWCLFKILSF